MDNPVLFNSLTKDVELQKALAKMKFTEATPVQAQSIPPMVAGSDITVQAPTGTGKTGAFGLPILEKIDPKDRTIQALILSPTRELAIQITDVLKALATFKPGIRITTIYGGERIEKQFALLRRRPQVVVATPGRLIDHMDRGTIKLHNLSILVLDEADRMLDMGFRPDLNRILKLVPKDRQTALFSATISKEIQTIAETYQVNPVSIKIEQGALTVDSVEQFYYIVNRNSKLDELVALFMEKHPKRSIVFTNTKRMSENIVFGLKKAGYRAAYLHGDLRQGQRNRVMSQYKSGRIDVLVATDVAARGIDVDDIDVVVNFDLPREEDSYVHRIGRTGRADKSGVAYTFIYKGEYADIVSLMKSTKADITELPASTGVVEKPADGGKKFDKSKQSRPGNFSKRPRVGRGGKDSSNEQAPRKSGFNKKRKPSPAGAKASDGGGSGRGYNKKPNTAGAKASGGSGRSYNKKPRSAQGGKGESGGSRD